MRYSTVQLITMLVQGGWLLKLTPGELRTLLALSSHADANGVGWPSIELLVKETGSSRSNVLRYLAHLAEAGLMVTIDAGGGRGRSAKRQIVIRQNGAAVQSEDSPVEASQEEPAHVQEPAAPKPPKPTKATRGDVADMPLPFQGEEFKAAWADWQQHRREIRKPLTPTATKRQLANLAGMGEAHAVAAIQRSLAAGWVGIFPEDKRANVTSRPSKHAGQYSESTTLEVFNG